MTLYLCLSVCLDLSLNPVSVAAPRVPVPLYLSICLGSDVVTSSEFAFVSVAISHWVMICIWVVCISLPDQFFWPCLLSVCACGVKSLSCPLCVSIFVHSVSRSLLGYVSWLLSNFTTFSILASVVVIISLRVTMSSVSLASSLFRWLFLSSSRCFFDCLYLCVSVSCAYFHPHCCVIHCHFPVYLFASSSSAWFRSRVSFQKLSEVDSFLKFYICVWFTPKSVTSPVATLVPVFSCISFLRLLVSCQLCSNNVYTLVGQIVPYFLCLCSIN